MRGLTNKEGEGPERKADGLGRHACGPPVDRDSETGTMSLTLPKVEQKSSTASGSTGGLSCNPNSSCVVRYPTSEYSCRNETACWFPSVRNDRYGVTSMASRMTRHTTCRRGGGLVGSGGAWPRGDRYAPQPGPAASAASAASAAAPATRGARRLQAPRWPRTRAAPGSAAVQPKTQRWVWRAWCPTLSVTLRAMVLGPGTLRLASLTAGSSITSRTMRNACGRRAAETDLGQAAFAGTRPAGLAGGGRARLREPGHSDEACGADGDEGCGLRLGPLPDGEPSAGAGWGCAFWGEGGSQPGSAGTRPGRVADGG